MFLMNLSTFRFKKKKLTLPLARYPRNRSRLLTRNARPEIPTDRHRRGYSRCTTHSPKPLQVELWQSSKLWMITLDSCNIATTQNISRLLGIRAHDTFVLSRRKEDTRSCRDDCERQRRLVITEEASGVLKTSSSLLPRCPLSHLLLGCTST